ncbi:DNA-directed RNA polymerase subunit alpha C-terminal domain-containing protein [Methylobacterium fujisawaense]|uniref:DNA-directed RNA polymerase subunit alpha C-terminal domain-containing protein n=1 Tax=Methylobacterium fujisawaense TaxID=107400 RepID=UPI00313E83D2
MTFSDETPLDDSGLPPRVVRILKSGNFATVGDLRAASDGELLRTRGFGNRAFYEVRKRFPNPDPEMAEIYREIYGWDI